MPRFHFTSAELKTVLAERQRPTVTLWNRLESRPRAREFGRALKSEVRDPLWMLSRQWQMGELSGDDAGSPAAAILSAQTQPLASLRGARGEANAIAKETPLEMQVERRSVRLSLNAQPIALDLRLAMGRRWLKLATAIGPYADAYRNAYPFRLLDGSNEANVQQAAHGEVAAMLLALGGRAMDGGALYQHLTEPAAVASDDVAIGSAHRSAIDEAGRSFVAWFEALIAKPEREDECWIPERIEHQFDLGGRAGNTAVVLHADQYPGGRLDWYDFDVVPRARAIASDTEASAPTLINATTLPTSVAFEGMPNARWWAFEDGKVNLADVRPEPNNMGALLLLEFLLVYSNDWHLTPITAPVGSLLQVDGLVVDNVFGERTWINPAGAGDDDDRRRWCMYGLSVQGDAREPADQRLLVLETTGAALHSEPIEQVALLRDEIANMVWGVERVIQSPLGGPKLGAEAGQEVRALLTHLAPPPAPAPAPLAAARYRVETSTPEHWIPFVPVRVPNSSRSIQLQRGVVRRILDDVEHGLVRPRTSLLREGLEANPQRAYFLFEEEVPRAGALVTLRYERARGADGRVHVWLAAQKGVGRGEGSSGLAFDLVEETKTEAT